MTSSSKKKNLWITLGIVFSIILIIVSLYFAFGTKQEQLGLTGTYIQAPTFYFYKCDAAPGGPVSNNPTYLVGGSSNGWITCPANTPSCDLHLVQNEQNSFFSTGRQFVYQICHANGQCDQRVYITADKLTIFSSSVISSPGLNIPNLLSTDKVWVDYQAKNILFQWVEDTDVNVAAWYQTYTPFILWKTDMFGGGSVPYTSIVQGCAFPYASSQLYPSYTGTMGSISNLLNSVTGSSKQITQQSSTSNSKLQFYETRNFIGTYVPISTANVNFVTYSGQTGYCTNKQVFSITTANTNGATYQIVDANFNNKLGDVICCPGDKTTTQICSSNFQWQNIAQAQCSSFKPCAGADWAPYSNDKLIRYNCVNSQCIPDYKTVQCTSNSNCQYGQVCDLTSYTCVNAPSGQITCGINQTLVDGKCVDNVPGQTNACNFWQTPVQTNTSGILGIGATQTTTCETDLGFVGFLAVILLIVLAFIVGLIYFIIKLTGGKKKRK